MKLSSQPGDYSMKNALSMKQGMMRPPRIQRAVTLTKKRISIKDAALRADSSAQPFSAKNATKGGFGASEPAEWKEQTVTAMLPAINGVVAQRDPTSHHGHNPTTIRWFSPGS